MIRPFCFLSRACCLVCCASFLLIACTPQPLAVTREPVVLPLVIADSCEPLAEELIAAYEESHPWVTVEVEVFNNSTAEQMLREDEVDLAFLSWMGEGADREGLWTQPFARDGIGVVVHPGMPFAEIGRLNLQEIYQGRVQEWGALVLTVVSREDGSGTRAAFENVVLGNYDTTRTAVVMPSSQAVVEWVARTPGGIGYVSTLWLSESDGVRLLPVEGVSVSSDTISDGSYLLWRWLYLATVGEPTGESREFAQWVLGSGGQAVVEGW
jgi:phosphate transport system substrate-binding protein